MAEENGNEFIKIFKDGYNAIFFNNWPIWLGGVLVGITSVITFAWARPWGVAGGLRNWGDWIFFLSGVYEKSPISPLVSTNSILVLGLLIGAFAAALMAKQFSFRMAPPYELFKGMIGGSLMGIGAAMAGGCNVGGFYSAISALSLSGPAMMLGLFIGAYIGLKFIYWELEHIPAKNNPKPKQANQSIEQIKPFLGFLVFCGSIYFAIRQSNNAYTIQGGLLLCGIAFGVIIQRTRFCFVRCFRDPFMTGEGEASKAMAVSLIISMLGFAALKWNGFRAEDIYIVKAFWIGGLGGGIIFGIGMLLSGGCGSGSVWRAGEGQIKLIVAVTFFALSTSLFKKLLRSSSELSKTMGDGVFVADYLGYAGGLFAFIALMLIYFVVAEWNDRTGKLIVDM